MSNFHPNLPSFKSVRGDVILSAANLAKKSHSSNMELIDSPDRNSNKQISSILIGGESSVYGASFNFVNSIVGAGLIAIPLAIQECGVVLGVLLLLLVAFLVNRSVLILINCGLETNKFDYEELAEHLLGKRGYYTTLIFMFLFAYGSQIAYLVIIGDTIPRAAQLLFPGSILCSRQNTLLLFSSLVVLPLCLFRQLSTLSWTSLLSIMSVVLIILIVLGACVNDTTHQDRHFEVSDTSEVNYSLFGGVGTMSFAFVCQHNSFIVFRSLARPTYQEWRKVAHLSVSFACFVCVAFGLIGFFTFYPYVKGDLLNNFAVDDYAIATARLFLAVTMIFTYPMEIFVSRHCVVAFARKYMEVTRAETGTAGDRERQDEINDGEVATTRSRESRTKQAGGSTASSMWESVSHTVNNVMCSLRSLSGTENNHSTHSPYGHLDSDNNRDSRRSNRGSPSKSRNQGNSTYTNVQDEGGGEGDDEEDVTILFVENRVLMLYDVPMDDAPTSSTANASSSATAGVGSGASSGKHGSVKNPLFKGAASPLEVESHISSRTRRGSMEPLTQKRSPVGRKKAVQRDSASTTRAANDEAAASPSPGDVSLPVHVLLTVALWASTLCIALVFSQLGVVSALTGAVAASVLGYILPAVLYLKTYETELHTAYARSLALYHGHGDSNAIIAGDDNGPTDTVMSPEDLEMEMAGVVEITFNIDDADDDAPKPPSSRKERTSLYAKVLRYVSMIAAFKQFFLSFGLIVFGIMSLFIGVTTVLMNAT